MARHFKSTVIVLAGICWLLFAAGFLLILTVDLAGGAGANIAAIFGISPFSVTLGLVNFIGLCAAAFVSLAVGFGLCSYGLTSKPAVETSKANGASGDLRNNSALIET
jgi:hypothetical protein